MAKWRSENQDHRKAYKKARREIELQQKLERYWRDPEAARAKQRAFYHGNPGPYRAKSAKWLADNPEYMAGYCSSDHYKILHREWERRRNAAKKATAVEKVSYEAILAEHGMICHICGERIADKSDLHFDHVVPLSRGGSHTAENIRPSHAWCNLSKHARPLEEVLLSA
jgi:5-methylcytosine-specific restriction endonuclease McrA